MRDVHAGLLKRDERHGRRTRRTVAERGARPCVGLLSLDDFAREAGGLHIRMDADA